MFASSARVVCTVALLSVSLASPTGAEQSSGKSSNGKGGGMGKGGTSLAWRDDFDGVALDTNRWSNVNGRAPGYRPGLHIGYYEPTSVRVVGGVLVIDLTQEYGYVDGVWGVISRGGLVSSRSTYGYGTYEWRMRMSSTATAPDDPGLPVSGSVSSGFNYVNNSKTEIDFEFTGHDSANIHMSNWYNTRPRWDPTESQLTSSSAFLPDITAAFKTYRFVWSPGTISYYVDDVLQVTHETNVPGAAAYFMVNHWGTDSPRWGGAAMVGPTRYLYVDWVQYTPAP